MGLIGPDLVSADAALVDGPAGVTYAVVPAKGARPISRCAVVRRRLRSAAEVGEPCVQRPKSPCRFGAIALGVDQALAGLGRATECLDPLTRFGRPRPKPLRTPTLRRHQPAPKPPRKHRRAPAPAHRGPTQDARPVHKEPVLVGPARGSFRFQRPRAALRIDRPAYQGA